MESVWEFVEKYKDEGLIELKPILENEIRQAEACRHNYNCGCDIFRQHAHAFLFYLNRGIKPAGIYEEEFEQFKPIVENLISKGHLLPSALEVFKSKD